MKPWYAVEVSHTCLQVLWSVVRTLEQALDIVQFAGIILLPEVLGLLGKVLALRERVSLVCDEIGGDCIELRHERGEVDGWMRRQLLGMVTVTGPAYSSMPLWPFGTYCLRQHPPRPLARGPRPAVARPGSFCSRRRCRRPCLFVRVMLGFTCKVLYGRRL